MSASTRLTQADRTVVDKVPKALGDGLEIYDWWRRAARENSYDDRFTMVSEYDRPGDSNYGFADDITVAGEPFPVVGTVQEIFYAQPKGPGDPGENAEWMRDQVREFMLRYFMRVASHRAPQFVPSKAVKEPPAWLRPVSLCAGGPVERRGWGYKQLYYKEASGEIGKFPESEQKAVVDVREIGERYEWVVLEVNVFDFALNLPPFTNGPTLSVPAKSVVNVVLSRDFVLDEAAPEDGLLGRYGWGYAFIRPDKDEDGLLGYGPDALGPAFMTFHFDVHDDGRALLFNAFAANQPTQLVKVSANPVDWGVEAADLASLGLLRPVLEPIRKASRSLPFGRAKLRPVFNSIRLANLLSGGAAARELCISKDWLLKFVMAMHFLDVYHFCLGTLETWNQIADWTAADSLPRWVVEGRSS